ncbi:MAG: HAD-IIIC family phosphatase [Proteobacteria bacterium]|nr:HAD-IIIC family phosphatase [Pseudomonadota bacterium]
MRLVDLHWLPAMPSAAADLRALSRAGAPALADLRPLAAARLDFVQTATLDRLLARALATPDRHLRPLRIALLGSSTLAHLEPALRVAGFRRGLALSVHRGGYGQYRQDLETPSPALAAFAPDTVLLALDAAHLAAGADPGLDAAAARALAARSVDSLIRCWRRARALWGAQVIQQTALASAAVPLLGANEPRLPGAPAALLAAINALLPDAAASEGVDLLALDAAAARDGLFAWHDPALWHRAKQEVSPAAAPAYGELAARLLAARAGLSAKCLVLDLDNTLWGGVIGDDGLEGIRLGQGSAEGEAFAAFQSYARDLSRRGVILAVVSKNDEAAALAPFDHHPDMVLRRADIACFVANWNDKPGNLRMVADRLNIGLDALAFADDNPFERALVRRELPMVAVPELPDDPALYARAIADSGCFEAVAITEDDRARTAAYRADAARAALRETETDLDGYLESLGMVLRWRRFDRTGLPRIVQLINKTNQFNLRTRRYSDAEAEALIADNASLALQLRLSDRFGDNGVIGVVIGKRADDALFLDTWLMSCRVLGRGVERATLNLLASEAGRMGAGALVGEYRPTPRNAMVRGHYAGLGFAQAGAEDDGAETWRRDLAGFVPFATSIAIEEARP